MFFPQSLGIQLLKAAKTGQSPQYWASVRSLLDTRFDKLSGQSMALGLNALARTGELSSRFLESLDQRLADKQTLLKLNVQDITLILNACAKINYRSANLLDPLLAEVLWVLPHGSSQELANLVSSLARLNYQSKAARKCVRHLIFWTHITRKKVLDTESLITIIFGLRLYGGILERGLFIKVALQKLGDLPEFSGSQICQLLFGLTKYQEQEPKLVAHEIHPYFNKIPKNHTFTQSQLCMLISASLVFARPTQEWWAQLDTRQLDVHRLGTLVASMSFAQEYHRPVIDALVDRVSELSRSDLLKVFEQVPLLEAHPDLLKALIPVVSHKLVDIPLNHLKSLLRPLEALWPDHEPLLKPVIQEIGDRLRHQGSLDGVFLNEETSDSRRSGQWRRKIL